MISKHKYTLVAIALPILLQACAANDPELHTKQGVAVGTIAGAVLGHQFHQDRGAIVGAALGALAGASVGRYQDEQQRALESSLRQEQLAKEIDIQRLQNETLKVSLSSEASFDFDQSDIKPAFYHALDKLAESLVRYDRTILHIIGHTDSVGSTDYNHALSIRRAQAVAQYLMLRGVPTMRLLIEGRGETEPVASNDNEQSRRLNRRVEIYIKPIIEGEENDALVAPRPS